MGKFIGKQVMIEDILSAIKEFQAYPVIEYIDNDFTIKVLPTSLSILANGGLSFGLNGGSLSSKKPQMTCFQLSNNALIYEVDNSFISYNSLKTFVINSSDNDRYVTLFFPQHLSHSFIEDLSLFKKLKLALIDTWQEFKNNVFKGDVDFNGKGNLSEKKSEFEQFMKEKNIQK